MICISLVVSDVEHFIHVPIGHLYYFIGILFQILFYAL